MTREEFAIIVKGMRAVYAQPSFIADKDAFDVWYELFAECPYSAVSAAVKAHMVSRTNIPTPADINEQLQKFKKGNSGSLPAAEEAWAMVRKAAQNAGYHSEEEFNKLPKIVQKAVGTPQNLSAWAMLEIDAFETVQKSHFVRQYNALVAREKGDERLPKHVRNIIESARYNPELEEFKNTRLADATPYEIAMKAYNEAQNSNLKTGDKEFAKELMLRYGKESADNG